MGKVFLLNSLFKIDLRNVSNQSQEQSYQSFQVYSHQMSQFRQVLDDAYKSNGIVYKQCPKVPPTLQGFLNATLVLHQANLTNLVEFYENSKPLTNKNASKNSNETQYSNSFIDLNVNKEFWLLWNTVSQFKRFQDYKFDWVDLIILKMWFKEQHEPAECERVALQPQRDQHWIGRALAAARMREQLQGGHNHTLPRSAATSQGAPLLPASHTAAAKCRVSDICGGADDAAQCAVQQGPRDERRLPRGPQSRWAHRLLHISWRRSGARGRPHIVLLSARSATFVRLNRQVWLQIAIRLSGGRCVCH